MTRAMALSRKLLAIGVKVRTIWLTFLVGILAGCLLMLAWTYTLMFATPQAIALIAWARG